LFLLRAGFHGKTSHFDENMRDIVNQVYIEGMNLVESVVYSDTFKISNLNTMIIPEKFNGIKYLTYFCSTIGSEIDDRIDDYQNRGEILRASLLDAWGSESVEEINNQYDILLRRKYGEGTMRFSPGYGEVSLLENIKIIALLNAEKISAHIKSGVLIPQKSTVCMIGWYSNTLMEEMNDR